MINKMEIWKAIPDYEGFYEASTMGRIRSTDRAVKHPRNPNMLLPRKGKVLRCELDKHGYPVVTLSLDGKTRTHKVHRLVALTFVPNPDRLPQVDHINATKYDNRPENLRWCSLKQNVKWRDELYKEVNRRQGKMLICKENRKTFRSSYAAAQWLISAKKTTSTNYKTVSNTVRSASNLGKPAYKFHWAYIEGSTTSSNERKGESSEMANPA